MSAPEVSFEVRPAESDVIVRLAARAHQLDVKHNGKLARKTIDWQMDFTAVHANGCPLKLLDLEGADDFNFMHDAFGICRHLDRETGQLTDLFVPRYSV